MLFNVCVYNTLTIYSLLRCCLHEDATWRKSCNSRAGCCAGQHLQKRGHLHFLKIPFKMMIWTKKNCAFNVYYVAFVTLVLTMSGPKSVDEDNPT